MNYFVFRWLKYSLVVFVGCGFLAMAVYAYIKRDEIRATQVEAPLIASPEEALKRRPDSPGGMEIPNRDKLVFDLLDNNAGHAGVSSTVAVYVSSVQAVTVNGPVDYASVSQVATSLSSSNVSQNTVSPAAIVSAMDVVQNAVATPLVTIPTVVSPVGDIKKVHVVSSSAQTAISQYVEHSQKSSSKKWGVQLAAVGSKADGDKMAVSLKAKYPALKNLKPRIVPAPSGGRYRVQFIGVEDRTAATAVCSKLAGQACFPVQ